VEAPHPLVPIADNLWVQHFHLRLFGTEQGRVVTIIRLRSGDLAIHSTAPFTPADVAAIRELGTPRWLLDAMLLHDTFVHEAMAAFPGVPLLGPPGFAEMCKAAAQPLIPPPAEWGDELEVLALEGMPKVREHLLFHRPSRTLIVADLVFNFDYEGNAWERLFRRWILGLKRQPDITRVFRLLWTIALPFAARSTRPWSGTSTASSWATKKWSGRKGNGDSRKRSRLRLFSTSVLKPNRFSAIFKRQGPAR
jgi:hypothetical protein